MNRPPAVPVLNRLLQTLLRSLPLYLQQTQPWTRPGAEPARDLLAAIAADQQSFARRVAEAVQEQGGPPDTGRFPTEFTDLHDLAVDFLVCKVLQRHHRDVETIRRSVQQLDDAPSLRSLAQEILDSALAHEEKLQALVAEK